MRKCCARANAGWSAERSLAASCAAGSAGEVPIDSGSSTCLSNIAGYDEGSVCAECSILRRQRLQEAGCDGDDCGCRYRRIGSERSGDGDLSTVGGEIAGRCVLPGAGVNGAAPAVCVAA